VVKDDIIHGHLEGIYFLKFLSIFFIFYRGKKGDPRGVVELRGEPKKVLWRMELMCATEMCSFCGAPSHVRHRKS
jgi:hypothetical protein